MEPRKNVPSYPEVGTCKMEYINKYILKGHSWGEKKEKKKKRMKNVKKDLVLHNHSYLGHFS